MKLRAGRPWVRGEVRISRRNHASVAPELTILPSQETGDYVLTYRARVMSRTGLTMYFIDAHSGDVVLQFSDLKTQQANVPCDNCDVGDGTGVLGDRKKVSVRSAAGTYLAHDLLRPPDLLTFDMQGNLNKTIDFLNGVTPLFDSDLASDPDNVWTGDGASVDAHVYAGWTYDYLFKRFGRRGLDSWKTRLLLKDIRIVSLVHPVRRQDVFTAPGHVFFLFYLNAFYAGNGVMVFGEGLPPGVTFLGRSWNFFAAALDIVAHELAHGVTDFSSQFIYQDKSGALNEAFSDIIATGVEFFFQESGSGPLQADYLLAEDIIVPLLASANRSLQNPVAFGDPDHYSNRFTGTADNGGVHTNSLIASHAFYLAIEGGTNATSGLGVTGVGAANRDQIENVFYRLFADLSTAVMEVEGRCRPNEIGVFYRSPRSNSPVGWRPPARAPLLGGGPARRRSRPGGRPALEALPADPVDFFETASSKPMTASLFTGSTEVAVLKAVKNRFIGHSCSCCRQTRHSRWPARRRSRPPVTCTVRAAQPSRR